MKPLLTLLAIGAAGILGYCVEPAVHAKLAARSAPARLPHAELEAPPVPASPPAAAAPEIDPAALPADQLPERVLLKAEVEVIDTASDVKMTIQAGNRLKLVRIEGADAIVSPGTGPFEGRLPVKATDLLEQLAARPPVAETQPPPLEAPAAEAVPAAPEPVPEAEAAPLEHSDAVTEPAGENAAPPPIPGLAEGDGIAPASEPPPEPAADADAALGTPATPAESETVRAMQASLRAGQIKEFTFGQVKEWKAGPDEVRDGKTYRTGVISYQAETVFGANVLEAKALILDGKVERWIWPKAGTEIK